MTSMTQITVPNSTVAPPQKQTSDGPQPTQKQTVRATASSPSEKLHLKTLHIVSLMTSTGMLPQQQKAGRFQQTASATETAAATTT